MVAKRSGDGKRQPKNEGSSSIDSKMQRLIDDLAWLSLPLLNFN